MDFTPADETRDTSADDARQLKLVETDIRAINEAIASAKLCGRSELMIQVPSRGRNKDTRNWILQVGQALKAADYKVTSSTSNVPHIRIEW